MCRCQNPLLHLDENAHPHLPTQVLADVEYFCPETYVGESGLGPIPETYVGECALVYIPDKNIRATMSTFCHDCEDCFGYGDYNFTQMVEMIEAEEQIELDQLDLVSVSVSFDTISTVLEDLGVKVLGSAYTTDE